MHIKLTQTGRNLLLLGTVCLAIRIPLFLTYEPNIYPDTLTYLSVAQNIKTLNFSNYVGDRPPVYPLFLLLTGMDATLAWWAQSLLGIGISLILFNIIFTHTQKRGLAYLAGFGYSLSVNSLLFEANLLAETLTTFLFCLSLWLVVRMRVKHYPGNAWNYLALGMLTGLSSLTRPQMLFLIPVYGLFLAYEHWRLKIASMANIKYLSIFALPAVACVIGWSLFNKITLDYFGVTTLFGYSMTKYSGGIMEQAPDQYATLRDIYLDYRTRQVENTGTYLLTIFRAIPEMQAVTGLSYSGLSKEMSEISLGLLSRNPGIYVKYAFKAWEGFWQPAMEWMDLGNLHQMTLRLILRYVRIMQEWILRFIYSIFLVIAIWHFIVTIRAPNRLGFHFLINLVILVAAITQALVEYGDNSRYALPFQPLILYSVVAWFYSIPKTSSYFT